MGKKEKVTESLFTKEEEQLLSDFSRNVSTKSSALFYGSAFMVSLLPICEYTCKTVLIRNKKSLVHRRSSYSQGSTGEFTWSKWCRPSYGSFLSRWAALTSSLLPIKTPSSYWNTRYAFTVCLFGQFYYNIVCLEAIE